MATVFWDARGIIHGDYLEKGKTINREYYANLWDRFNHAVKEKNPHLAKDKIIFHQDNARVRTCVVAMAKFHELGANCFLHPPYSPDLAPVIIFYFQKWKNGSNDEVGDCWNKRLFWRVGETLFFRGGTKDRKSWTKCIELKRYYIKK